MSTRVSVVVPTYNRPEMLERCLAALMEQTLDPATYEVIVADDGASPQVRQLVEEWIERALAAGRAPRQSSDTNGRPVWPELIYVPVQGSHGPARARNAGWQMACGDIVAFTDDDCIPSPGWLQAGLAAFNDGIVGAAGRIVVPLADHPTDHERNAAKLENGEFVTANCFYRRDALNQVGGFDERFTAPWREDSDLFFSLMERGRRLVRVPEAVVVHPVRPASWGQSLRDQRKSAFNALLYQKHPELYRQRIRPGRPWHYYAILAASLMALAGALGGHRRMALGAASAWTLMTGLFCAQRLQGTSHTPGHMAEMAVTSILIPPLSIFWRILGAIKFRVFFF